MHLAGSQRWFSLCITASRRRLGITGVPVAYSGLRGMLLRRSAGPAQPQSFQQFSCFSGVLEKKNEVLVSCWLITRLCLLAFETALSSTLNCVLSRRTLEFLIGSHCRCDQSNQPCSSAYKGTVVAKYKWWVRYAQNGKLTIPRRPNIGLYFIRA